ncbi:MAG TPA: response regulator transcription factor [Ktedonobacterales bacterium]|jgi:DNA-binding NarL/FixJ family response regulator|nr:response regulator transcription factor [Ktedonobacterales bacterium]
MGTQSTSVIEGIHADVSASEMLGEEPAQSQHVLIIEDHPVYADGLQAILEARGPYRVVGIAGTANAALTMARQYNPQIILLDVELPSVNGFDLVSPISRICPQAKTIILTGHSEDEYALKAVRLGVHGFLQKDMTASQLLGAIEQVARGERVIGKPQTLTTVLTECSTLMRDRDREKLGVSGQEVEIIRLAASGLSNKDIGIHQFWSEITVKRKMQDIYRKLSVKTRAQAVAEAIRLGYI